MRLLFDDLWQLFTHLRGIRLKLLLGGWRAILSYSVQNSRISLVAVIGVEDLLDVSCRLEIFKLAVVVRGNFSDGGKQIFFLVTVDWRKKLHTLLKGKVGIVECDVSLFDYFGRQLTL